jgi:hypothetical protein
MLACASSLFPGASSRNTWAVGQSAADVDILTVDLVGSCVLPLSQLQALYALVPAHPKQFIVVSELPGIHGLDLLTDVNGQPERLDAVVASWILSA